MIMSTTEPKSAGRKQKTHHLTIFVKGKNYSTVHNTFKTFKLSLYVVAKSHSV